MIKLTPVLRYAKNPLRTFHRNFVVDG